MTNRTSSAMIARAGAMLLAIAILALPAAAGADAPPAASATQPRDDASAPRPESPQKISVGQAAVLGVVEGVTEYLPVSSTGHLILAGHWMGLTHYVADPQTGQLAHGPLGPRLDKKKMRAVDSFEIVIQLGAVLAVLGLYRRRVAQMARGLVGRDPAGRKLLVLLILAFLPAAIVGLLFHKKIEEHLFGPVPVLIALVAGGVLMIVVEKFFWPGRRQGGKGAGIESLGYWQALFIGVAQCLAMWPGTSRSMITMLAALMVGLSMVAAAEFSFLLALPTLGSATIFSALKDWDVLLESTGFDGLLVGLVVSAVVAAIAVKAFVKWLTNHGMVPFGVYRIILAGAFFLVLA